MIYKNVLKWGAALLVANLALVSCEDHNEGLTDGRVQKPVLTISNVTASGVEGSDVTFTVTSDKPIAQAIDFKLEVVNGESVATFRDFTADGTESTIGDGGFSQGQIGYLMSFPAYATTHTFTITLERDLLIEGTETLELFARSSGNGLGLIAEGTERMTIAVSDYVSNDISLSLDWTTDYYDDFGSYVEGDFHDYDFDMYLVNSLLDDVSGAQAAGSNVPEQAEVLSTAMADGTYAIVVDFYSKPAAAALPAIPVTIPVKLTVSKNGVWSETLTLTNFKSNSPVSGGNGLNGGEVIVATLVKTGTTYQLLEGDGSTNVILASGRMADLSNIGGRRNR